MTQIKLIFSILLLLCAAQSSAQVFPFVTDYGSLSGSSAAAGNYTGLGFQSNNPFSSRGGDLKDRIRSFRRVFDERSEYFAIALPLSISVDRKIKNQILQSYSRYNNLQDRNESLSLFSYSKKKNNKKLLELVSTMLYNLNKEIQNQSTSLVVLGEKLNVYQDVMMSLQDIDRMMDNIEDNIEKSNFYYRAFN